MEVDGEEKVGRVAAKKLCDVEKQRVVVGVKEQLAQICGCLYLALGRTVGINQSRMALLGLV